MWFQPLFLLRQSQSVTFWRRRPCLNHELLFVYPSCLFGVIGELCLLQFPCFHVSGARTAFFSLSLSAHPPICMRT